MENKDARLELIPGPSGPGRIVQLSGYHYHNPDEADDPTRGAEYLRRTLLFNLKHGAIDLPVSLERQRAGEVDAIERVTLKEMGIYYPVLVDPGVIDDQFRLLDPEAAAQARKKILESMVKSAPGRSGGANRQLGGGAGGGRGDMMGGGMGGSLAGGMSGSMTGGMGGGMNSMNNSIASQLSPDKILNLNRYDFTIQFVWMETPPSDRDARRKAAEEAAKAEAGESTENAETADGGETAETTPAESTVTETAPTDVNAESAAEPAADANAEPAAEPAADANAEPAAEPAADASAEPAAEPAPAEPETT